MPEFQISQRHRLPIPITSNHQKYQTPSSTQSNYKNTKNSEQFRTPKIPKIDNTYHRGTVVAGHPRNFSSRPRYSPGPGLFLFLPVCPLDVSRPSNNTERRPPLTRVPLCWCLCIISWNSSSIFVYLASVRGVRLYSIASGSGLSGDMAPLCSFLLSACKCQQTGSRDHTARGHSTFACTLI